MLEYEELGPKIFVYKNLFNSQEFFDSLEHVKSLESEWIPWYTFGTQWNFPLKTTRGTTGLEVISEQEFKQDINFDEIKDEKVKFFCNYVEDVFYKTTKHYFETTGEMQPDNSPKTHTTCTLLKYTPHEMFADLVMSYHTDFVQQKTEEPGRKFFVTCNMYLNENYSGGEVAFKILKDVNNPNTSETDDFLYTPKTGEVVIFPSRSPYYHAVKTVNEGEKYFIRSFYMYEYPGSEAWHANKAKYGDAWEEMELQRQKDESKSGKYNLGSSNMSGKGY